MRGCLTLLVAWLALAGQVRAADLTTVDRSLPKEPSYESASPQYGLLVFGPDATVRVWVVLDGNVLYVDRNGNGDLTDPGERLVPRKVWRRPGGRPEAEAMRDYELVGRTPDGGPILSCAPEVSWFHLIHIILRDDYRDRNRLRFWRERQFQVAVTTRHGGQRAEVRFADDPHDAPVIPFDGTRRFALSRTLRQHIFRPGETSHLAVELHSKGLSATVRTDFGAIPDDVHPVAEIEFPPASDDAAPIRLSVQLTERC